MRSPRALLMLLLCTLLACIPTAFSLSKMEELQKLRAKSAVIKMDSQELDRFTAGGSRPYALMVFWNAPKIKEAKNIKLQEQLERFKFIAKTARNAAKKDPAHSANSVFFVEIDMEQSRDMFQRFGVTNLPWVTHVGKDMGRQPGGQWQIHQDETMTPQVYGRGIWEVTKYTRFLEARVHVHLGPVQEPSALQDPVLLAVLLMLLVPGAYAGWRIYTSSWIGNPWIWSVAVMAVFMFATSGGMYNIIRGIPLVRQQENGQVEWFQGGQGQLGMEGFVVGSLYVSFAVSCLGLLLVPELSSSAATVRTVSIVCMVCAVLILRQIIHFYRWKTGYHLRFYLGEKLGIW
eukprot:jgi/Ulvmu1/2182/UM013_0027.1